MRIIHHGSSVFVALFGLMFMLTLSGFKAGASTKEHLAHLAILGAIVILTAASWYIRQWSFKRAYPMASKYIKL